MRQDILMTNEGYAKIEEELNQLIRVEREIIKKAIKRARRPQRKCRVSRCKR